MLYIRCLGEDCLAIMDAEQGTFNTVNYPSPYPADLGKVFLY